MTAEACGPKPEMVVKGDPGDKISLLGGKVLLDRDFVVANAYLRSDDAIIVGGSLLEGVGNFNSDVDAYVLTDRLRRRNEIRLDSHFRVFGPDRSILGPSDEKSEVFLVHTMIPGERIKLDIEYRTWAELSEIADQVEGLFEHARKSLISLTTLIERRTLAFIHRLHNSKVLRASTKLADLRERLSLEKLRYLLYRWKIADFSVLLDMQGAWNEGDFIRCADMARENMVTQFHAYTHLCGNSSYNRKWIIPYANRLNLDGTLLDEYLMLLTAGMGRSDDELREFIWSTLDFVDRVLLACSERLYHESLYPSGADALSAIDSFFRSEAGDYSEIEIAYCKKPYGESPLPTRAWFRR